MKLSFKPEQVTKSLLGALSERARDIIERRYGLLNKGSERMTLEAIGQIYGITRERVRQIENAALSTIRQSSAFDDASGAFDELQAKLIEFGGVAKEDEFLSAISKDEGVQNKIHFLLVLGDQFIKLKEDDHFHHRWTTDEEFAGNIHQALTNLYKTLSLKDLIAEDEMIKRFLEELRSISVEVRDEEILRRWLAISKKVENNPLGDWGLSHSPNIKARGIRDLAYLVLKKEQSPMHFSEVARAITDEFGKKAHTATCHNELIKDDRFVLVGRGLYALSEWGYTSGVVRDVIKSVLDKKGPLTKDDIIKEVKKQRSVKENTIYVNLQNARHFKKDKSGRYSLA